MPKPVAGDRHYMAGIDGLRAFAVLLVILYHLDARWAPGGLLGVAVFFVLSGYLITDLLQAEWARNGALNLKAFWVRRARRLLPALLVMLSVVVGWVAISNPPLLPEIRSDALAALAYLGNWWFIYHHVSYFARWGPPTPVGHLWSLAVEEQFYLVWPLFLVIGFRYLKRSWFIAVVLLLALLSAGEMACLYHPGMNPNRVYYGTDTRAFALLIGAAAALLWPSQRLADRRDAGRWDRVGLAGLAVVVVLVLTTSEQSPFLYRGGMLLFAGAAASVVLAAAHAATRLGRWLGSAGPRWVGVRSYGIYLWHYPIIVLTTPPNAAPDLTRMAWQVGAAILLAALSWRYIEEPIRRGKLDLRWSSRLRQSPTGPMPRTAATAAGTSVVLTLSASLSLVVLSSAASPARFGMPTTAIVIPRPAGSRSAADPARRSPHAAADRRAKAVPAGAGVTAIGDSVLIDATPDLERLLPGIVADGLVGRQMYQAPEVIQWLRRHGDMGHRVFVLELGTNGPFTPSLLLAVLRDAQPVAHILLVNTRVPRPWQSQVNATLWRVARTYPDTSVVNWYRASANHSAWFYPDGVHLNPTGALAYAALIAQAVRAAEQSSASSPAAPPHLSGARPSAVAAGS